MPTVVERTMVRPPSSRMGPITPEERQKIVKNSPVYGNYEEAEDRESAYEILTKRAEERSAANEQEKADRAAQKEADQQARAQSRTEPRMRCQAWAMSAWARCGHPRAWQMPCFHSTLRGTVGHAGSPTRAGLTACQIST